MFIFSQSVSLRHNTNTKSRGNLRKKAWKLAAAVAGVGMLFSASAQAANKTWSGADYLNNTNWSNPLNWTGGVAPSVLDTADVVFDPKFFALDGNSQPTYQDYTTLVPDSSGSPTASTINSLNFLVSDPSSHAPTNHFYFNTNNAYTLTLSGTGNAFVNQWPNVTGNNNQIYLHPYLTLNFANGGLLNSGRLSVQGDMTFNGTSAASQLTNDGLGNFNKIAFANGGVITNSGNAYFNSEVGFLGAIGDGKITNTGAGTMSFGDLRFANGGTISNQSTATDPNITLTINQLLIPTGTSVFPTLSGPIQLGTLDQQGTGTMTLGGALVLTNQYLTIQGSGNTTVNVPLATVVGSNTVGVTNLTKGGTGTLILGQDYTPPNGLTLALRAGELIIPSLSRLGPNGSTRALQSMADDGPATLTITSAGPNESIYMSSIGQSSSPLVSTATFNIAAGRQITLTGTNGYTGVNVYGGPGGNAVTTLDAIANVGGGALVLGDPSLEATAPAGNTFKGNIRIDNGVVVVPAPKSLGNGYNTVVFNGGTLRLLDYVSSTAGPTLGQHFGFDPGSGGDLVNGKAPDYTTTTLGVDNSNNRKFEVRTNSTLDLQAAFLQVNDGGQLWGNGTLTVKNTGSLTTGGRLLLDADYSVTNAAATPPVSPFTGSIIIDSGGLVRLGNAAGAGGAPVAGDTTRVTSGGPITVNTGGVLASAAGGIVPNTINLAGGKLGSSQRDGNFGGPVNIGTVATFDSADADTAQFLGNVTATNRNTTLSGIVNDGGNKISITSSVAGVDNVTKGLFVSGMTNVITASNWTIAPGGVLEVAYTSPTTTSIANVSAIKQDNNTTSNSGPIFGIRTDMAALDLSAPGSLPTLSTGQSGGNYGYYVGNITTGSPTVTIGAVTIPDGNRFSVGSESNGVLRSNVPLTFGGAATLNVVGGNLRVEAQPVQTDPSKSVTVMGNATGNVLLTNNVAYALQDLRPASGNVNVDAGSSLGVTSKLEFSGGTINLVNGSTPGTLNLNFGGPLTMSATAGSSVIANSGAGNAGSVQVTGGAMKVSVSTGANLTIFAPIVSGTNGLIKNGGGILKLPTDNASGGISAGTINGTVTVNAGVLHVDNTPTALGTATGANKTIVLNGTDGGGLKFTGIPNLAAGLQEGRITGTTALDSTTPNPANFPFRLGLRMAQLQTTSADPNLGWGSNETWVYTGQMFDADGKFSFAENIDDSTWIKIDNTVVLSNGTWNQVTSTGTTDGKNADGTTAANANANGGTTSFGMGPNGDGWHNIEVRVQNGTGGAGPVAALGFTATKGVGFSSTPLTGADLLDGTKYTAPVDDGSASLFRYAQGLKGLDMSAHDLDAAGTNTSIDLSGSFTGQLSKIGAVSLHAGNTFTVYGTGTILQATSTSLNGSGTITIGSAITTADTRGDAEFRTGKITDGANTGITLNVLTSNSLTLDNTQLSPNNNDLNGTTVNLGTNGRLTGIGASGGSDPLAGLTINIQGDSGALRLSSATAPTAAPSFIAKLVLNANGKIEHTGTSFDTLGDDSVANNPVVAMGGSSLTTDIATGGGLTLGGTLTGSGSSGLTKIGGGTLTLGGASANTFSGMTNVNAGSLILSKPAGTQAVASVTVNTSAALKNVNNEQIAGGLTMAGGSYDLAGKGEFVSSLTANGGTISTSVAGGTVLTPALSMSNPGSTTTISARLQAAQNFGGTQLASLTPWDVTSGTLNLNNVGPAGSENKLQNVLFRVGNGATLGAIGSPVPNPTSSFTSINGAKIQLNNGSTLAAGTGELGYIGQIWYPQNATNASVGTSGATASPWLASAGNSFTTVNATLATAAQKTITTSASINFPQNGPPTADSKFNALFGYTTSPNDNFTAIFTGYFVAPTTGTYTFGTGKIDDMATILIDTNQNGVFDGPDFNMYLSGASGSRTGTVALTAGQAYKLAFGVTDTGGESGLIFQWADPGGTLAAVDPLGNALGRFFTSNIGVGTQDFSGVNGTDVNVADNGGTVNFKVASGSALYNNLSLSGNNTLNITGASLFRVGFHDTTIPSGTNTFTVNGTAGFAPGILNDTGKSVTWNIGNANGVMILDNTSNATPNHLNNTIFNLNGGGVLQVMASNVVGSTADPLGGTGVINISGGTLRVTNKDGTGSITVAADLNISGSGTIEHTGTTTDTFQGRTAGPLVLGYNTLTLLGTAGKLNIDQSISDGPFGGQGNLTKTGPGTMSLNRVNSYTGYTTVNGGELDLNATGGLSVPGNLIINVPSPNPSGLVPIVRLLQPNQIWPNALVTLTAGVLDMGTNNNTINTLTVDNSGAAALATILGTGEIVASYYNLTNGTINAPLGGSGGINKNSPGLLILAGGAATGPGSDKGYTGQTLVQQGILRVGGSGGLGAPGAIGSGSDTVVSAGAQLQLMGTFAISGAEGITIAGTGPTNDGAIRAVGGTMSVGGAVTLTSDSSIQVDFASLTVNAIGTSGSSQNLVVQGLGDLTIGTGGINLNGGVLTKNGAGSLTIGGNNSVFPILLSNWNGGIIGFSGPQSFGAYTIPNGRALRFNTDPGAGVNITVPAGLTLISGITTQADMTGMFTGAPNNRINPISAGTFALPSDTNLNIDMAAAGLNNLGIGAIGMIKYGGTITPAGGAYRFSAATAGTGLAPNILTVTGPLTGANAVRVSGGIVDFSRRSNLTTTPNYSGGTFLTGGTLRYVNDPELGLPSSDVTLDGGTLQYLSTNAASVASQFGFLGSGLNTSVGMTYFTGGLGNSARMINVASTGTLDVVANTSGGDGLTMSVPNGITGGAGTTLTKAGYGQLLVLQPLDGTGTNTGFKGNLVLAPSSGQFNILASGYVRGLASVTVNQSSIFQTDTNTGMGSSREFPYNAQVNPNDPLGFTTESDRIGNNIPITLNGGTLNFQGRNVAFGVGAGNLERVGTVTAGLGQDTIQAVRTGSGGAELVITNLIRNASDHATIRFNSSNTMGNDGDNGRLVPVKINSATPTDNQFLGGWATVDGTDFAIYRTQSAAGKAGGIVKYGFTPLNGSTAIAPVTTPYAALSTTTTAGGGGFVSGAIGVTGTVATPADVTLGTPGSAQNFVVGGIRFTGAATRQLLFANTTNVDTLYVESGGILSDGNNNARNIGTNTNIYTRGRLTAGTITATAPQELFLHNNSNTFTINSQIIDNPAGGVVTVVKDLDATVTLDSGSQTNSAANSYSGGTYVLRGTLTANQPGTLGTGPVTVKNAWLNLGNKAATSSTAGYTLFDNAQVTLQNNTAGAAGSYDGIGDHFNLASGCSIYANSPGMGYGMNSLTRVNTPTDLTGGGQIYLAPDSIVRHNMTNAPDQGSNQPGTGAYLTINNLGTNADLYFSPGNNGGDQQTLTVGAYTPWKGLSSTRDGVRWQQGTIIANGDFYLQGLVRDGGNQSLFLGIAGSTGTYTITNAAGRPINAFVKGQVILEGDTNCSLPSDMTFVATPGSTMTVNVAGAFGSGTNIAKLLVQGGANIDPGNYVGLGANPDPVYPLLRGLPTALVSPLNGSATFEAGSRLVINDASGIGSAPVGSWTMKPDSVLELATANAFFGRGMQPLGGAADSTGFINAGQFVYEPGAIVRLNADNINKISQSVNGQGVVLELWNAGRTLTSQSEPYLASSYNQYANVAAGTRGTFVPETISLGSGGMLTNDAADRNFNQGRGGLILNDGVTLAATTLTYLNMSQAFNISAGANITIGSNRWIENMPKLGTVALITTLSNTAGAGAKATVINGAQLQFGAQNVWPDTAAIDLPSVVTNYAASGTGTSAQMPGNGSSIVLTQGGFTEVMGSLTGSGAIIGTTNVSLGVGYGNADFTSNVVFKSTNGQNPELVKLGTGKMTYTGMSDSNASVVVAQGELSISGTGNTKFAAARILKGGTFTIDNSAAAGGTRALATLPVGSRLNNVSGFFAVGAGGTLRFVGNETTPSVEYMANLASGSGNSASFALNSGYSTINMLPAAGVQATLAFGAIENFQSAGTRSSTYVIHSPSIGNAPGSYSTTGVFAPNATNNTTGLIVVATPNLGQGGNFGLGAGGTITYAAGTATVPTFPHILGETGLNNGTLGFVTEDLLTYVGAGTTSGSTTVTVPTTTGMAVGMPVSGTGIPTGSVITSIVNGTSFTIGNPASTFVATTSAGSNAITSSTAGLTGGVVLANGMAVTGAGIPAGSIIEGLSGTAFTIATPAGSLTGTWANGGTVISTTNTANLVDGMQVTGTGIPAGATIVLGSIVPGVSFTISAPATAAGTAAALRLPALNNATATSTQTLGIVNASNNNNATATGTINITVPGGLRMLSSSEYASAIPDGGTMNFPLNVKLPNASVTNVSGATRIQTLTMTGTTTVNVNNPLPFSVIPSQLELTVGGLLVQSGATGNINGGGNTVLRANGGVGLYLHTQGDLNLNNIRAYSDTALVKTGPGTLNVGDNGLSFTRTTIQVDDGIVNLGTNNSFLAIRNQNGFSGLNLYMNGGELKLNGNSQNINQLNSSNALPGAGTGGGIISSTTPATLTIGSGNTLSSFSGQITGNINLDKVGTQQQLLTGASSFTGTTTVRGGELRLRDLGQLTNTSSVGLTYGTLSLYDGYLNHVDNRIPSGVNVDMKGSTLALYGAPALVSNQVLGNVNLLGGRNDIQSVAGGMGANVITIGNLTNAGHNGSTVMFGQNSGFIGSTAGDAGATIRDLITNINGQPVASALVNNILPTWIIVNGDHFAAYRPGTGISYLSNTADGYANYDNVTLTTADWTLPATLATHNVTDGTARTLTASKTINAFRETGTVTNTFNAGVGLTLASGGFITNGGNFAWANAPSTTGQYLTSGSGELDIWVNQNTTSINVPITNNPLTPTAPMDVVKSGSATLGLNPAAIYTGTATAGSTTIAMTNTTGLAVGMFVGSGSASVFPVVNTTNNTPITATITAINPGVSITVSNAPTTGGSDIRVLVSGNTYTGTTFVNSGTLNLNLPGANGTTLVGIPGDLVIQSGAQGAIATVTEATVANQLKNTANVTLAGSARFNLANVPNVTETIASVTFADAGGTGTTMNLARTALQRTSVLNLSAPVAITANNTNPAVVPYVDTWLGKIGFTNADGKGSTLNINGPTTANGLGALGLRIDAVVASVPASIPGGSLIKTGTGMLDLNSVLQVAGITATNASTQGTLLDTTNFYVGMPVTGTGIPNGSFVSAFVPGIGTAGSFTLSTNFTATNTNQTFAFTPAPSQMYGGQTGYNGTLASLTDVLNVSQGITRVDRFSALGTNSANTTVQSGAVLLGAADVNANANIGVTGSIKLMAGSSLGLTTNSTTFGQATSLVNSQSVMNVAGNTTFYARDYFMTAANAMAITIASKLTGSGNINIVGPETFLAGQSTVTLSNPLANNPTGGNDYSGTITVGPSVTLVSQPNTSVLYAATTATGSNTITLVSATGLAAATAPTVGDPISGAGIPANATIGTVVDATHFTILTENTTPFCNTTSGSTTVTANSTTGFVVGGAVTGAGIPAGATVASVTNATTFVISTPATATATGVTLTLPNNSFATASAPIVLTRRTGAVTGSDLGTAAINLNGGRLSLRDDGNLLAELSNQTFNYGNNVILNANSYLDANRVNAGWINASANNIINLGSLTVNGTRTLTVDSGNGYQVGFSDLLGTGKLVKAGQSQLNVNKASPAVFTTGLGIAGPVGLAFAPTFNTPTFDNIVLPADTTIASLDVNGSYITATSKTLNVVGTLAVNANPGNVSGMLLVRNNTTLTAGSVVNEGQISGSASGPATITSATGFTGSGLYMTSSYPLTLAGPAVSGTLKVAGGNTVAVTASSITASSAEIQSGTLRISPTAPLSFSTPIRILGTVPSTASTTTTPVAAISGTLQFDGGTQPINYTGNIPSAGTVRASSGVTTVNGVISGGATSYAAGLLEGYMNNAALDSTTARPANPGNFGIRLEPRMGQTNIVTQNAYTGHLDNDLWVYTGYVKDDDGVFSFAANIDDRVAVWIDGTLVLNGNGNNVASTAYSTNNTGTTPTQNFGAGITLPGLGSGWHLFEARFQNGAGGAGPYSGPGFNVNYGFGLKNGIGALNGADYIKPIDNGTGNLFVTPLSTSKGNVQVDSGATLNATQIIQTANATLGASATGGTLNLTGTAASQIDKLTVTGTGSATLTNNVAGASALTLGAVAIASTATLNHTAGLNTVITGNATGGGTLNSTLAGITFNSDTAQTASVSMAGTGGLLKTGTGTLTVNAKQTYDGGTVINGGKMVLQAQASAGGGSEGVFVNVPEASNYRLVYSLPIPNGSNFSTSVPYAVNNASTISTGSFSRVGYYMELDTGSGLQYVYASFDAATFNTDASKLGVPNVASGEYYRKGLGTGVGEVVNMNIVSNVAGIVTGTGITTGNVEFWPSNYGAANDYGIAGASATAFDFGDGGSGMTQGHGSMQIHNYGASQTLFAFNNWNGGGGELGIGNRPTGEPDWTFAANAGTYTVKNLYVVVDGGAPGISSDILPTATTLSIAAGSTLDMNGVSQQLAALSNHLGSGGSVTNGGTNNVTLTLNGGTASFAGVISDGPTNKIALAKSGSGIQTFTKANTYTGGTTISGGTLVAANGAIGSATGSGSVTLDGGTLAGSPAGGTIAGPVLAGIGAHTIAPGAGLASPTFGTLTLDGGLTTNSYTTLAFNLGAPVAGGIYNGDLLFVNGAGLTAGTGTNMAFSFGVGTPAIGDYFRLIGGSFGTPDLNNFVLPATGVPGTRFELSSTKELGWIDLVLAAGATTYNWKGTSSDWHTAGNWVTNIPGAGKTAVFSDVTGTGATVDLANANGTVGGLTFNTNVASVTIASSGTGKLVLDNLGSSVVADVTGSHSITAAMVGTSTLSKTGLGTLTLGGDNSGLTGGTNINAGTLRTTHPNALGGPAATATVGTLGTLQVAAPGVNLAALNNNGATNLTAGATSIPTITGAGDLTVAAAPASLSANSIHQTKLTVNGTVNVPAAIGSGIVLGTVDGSGNTVTPGTLSLGAAGVVDLNDRPLVIHYDPAGVNPAVMIKNALAAGRNVAPGGVADGTWDGLTGIRSTTAAQAYVAAGGTEFLALGYGDTANMPFNDAPDMQGLASTVFVKYTRVGDASMDGIVGDTDVTVLGALYDPSYDPTGPGGPKHWYEGDFNYNGIVDDSDVTLLGANYDPTQPPMFASLSSQYGSAFAAAFIKGYDSTHSGATTVVPEPGALTLLGLGALGLIRRKRRQA